MRMVALISSNDGDDDGGGDDNADGEARPRRAHTGANHDDGGGDDDGDIVQAGHFRRPRMPTLICRPPVATPQHSESDQEAPQMNWLSKHPTVPDSALVLPAAALNAPSAAIAPRSPAIFLSIFSSPTDMTRRNADSRQRGHKAMVPRAIPRRFQLMVRLLACAPCDLRQELPQQPAHFRGLFLLHPMAGAVDQMTAEHVRASG